MIKLLLISTLSLILSHNAQAFECGGVDSKVFDDVQLSLENLYNDDVYEEGLSFHEYPDFGIRLEEDGGYYLSVGAAGFSGASRKELVCNNGRYEMQVDYDNLFEVVFKDFKYVDSRVTEASVYYLESEDTKNFSKLADFTTEGKKVVYASIRMVEKSEQATVISQYVNLGDYLDIGIDSYGNYEINIGSLYIEAHAGNKKGNVAILKDDTLYLEAPTLNLYLEIRLSKIACDGKADVANVSVGQLDSIKPAVVLGKFE